MPLDSTFPASVPEFLSRLALQRREGDLSSDSSVSDCWMNVTVEMPNEDGDGMSAADMIVYFDVYDYRRDFNGDYDYDLTIVGVGFDGIPHCPLFAADKARIVSEFAARRRDAEEIADEWRRG